jgi:glycosyltransferase involved in cell wall biosynthesis
MTGSGRNVTQNKATSARIALVYGDYPPNPPGRSDGGSDFLQHLAEGLVKRGFDVTAIVSGREDRRTPFTQAGVRIEPIVERWSLRAAFGGQLAGVRRVLNERNVDLVHLIYPDPFLRYGSNSYRLPFLLKVARRPVVVTFFGFGVTGGGVVSNAGLLSLFATSDRVVITDADLLRRFQRRLPWWAAKARGGLVGGIAPADAPRWSASHLAERKAALGLDTSRRHIGFFGFWSPDKGLENLLHAQVELQKQGRGTTLVLIGGRPRDKRFAYEQGIVEMAERIGIVDSMVETGPLPAAQVASYLLAMDVCVLPFKVNPTGRSSLALALGLGVPTLVTRPTGPESQLLEDSPTLGSLEPAAIAEAISQLLETPGGLTRASEAALRASRHWSWEAIVDEYALLYGELLGGDDRR